jgi:hypothetical protein
VQKPRLSTYASVPWNVTWKRGCSRYLDRIANFKVLKEREKGIMTIGPQKTISPIHVS